MSKRPDSEHRAVSAVSDLRSRWARNPGPRGSLRPPARRSAHRRRTGRVTTLLDETASKRPWPSGIHTISPGVRRNDQIHAIHKRRSRSGLGRVGYALDLAWPSPSDEPGQTGVNPCAAIPAATDRFSWAASPDHSNRTIYRIGPQQHPFTARQRRSGSGPFCLDPARESPFADRCRVAYQASGCRTQLGLRGGHCSEQRQ
jgi:hypothetical protein